MVDRIGGAPLGAPIDPSNKPDPVTEQAKKQCTDFIAEAQSNPALAKFAEYLKVHFDIYIKNHAHFDSEEFVKTFLEMLPGVVEGTDIYTLINMSVYGSNPEFLKGHGPLTPQMLNSVLSHYPLIWAPVRESVADTVVNSLLLKYTALLNSGDSTSATAQALKNVWTAVIKGLYHDHFIDIKIVEMGTILDLVPDFTKNDGFAALAAKLMEAVMQSSGERIDVVAAMQNVLKIDIYFQYNLLYDNKDLNTVMNMTFFHGLKLPEHTPMSDAIVAARIMLRDAKGDVDRALASFLMQRIKELGPNAPLQSLTAWAQNLFDTSDSFTWGGRTYLWTAATNLATYEAITNSHNPTSLQEMRQKIEEWMGRFPNGSPEKQFGQFILNMIGDSRTVFQVTEKINDWMKSHDVYFEFQGLQPDEFDDVWKNILPGLTPPPVLPIDRAMAEAARYYNNNPLAGYDKKMFNELFTQLINSRRTGQPTPKEIAGWMETIKKGLSPDIQAEWDTIKTKLV